MRGPKSKQLNEVFSALSDPIRREILAHLASKDFPVNELADFFDVSRPAISKHLAVLERAGLISRKKDGRIHRCRLVAKRMKDAAEWIDRYRVFWDGQFDALEKFLADEEKGRI